MQPWTTSDDKGTEEDHAEENIKTINVQHLL
mgnify:CR=1 FL=1